MFTKGQEVRVIRHWTSGEGTRTQPGDGFVQFYVERGVVYSCGKVQMIINDLNGQKFQGSNFKPTEEQWNFDLVLACTDEEALVRADEQAAKYVANEIARTQHAIANSSSYTGFTKLMQEKLECLQSKGFKPAFIRK
jgi:hypothetical protein